MITLSAEEARELSVLSRNTIYQSALKNLCKELQNRINETAEQGLFEISFYIPNTYETDVIDLLRTNGYQYEYIYSSSENGQKEYKISWEE